MLQETFRMGCACCSLLFEKQSFHDKSQVRLWYYCSSPVVLGPNYVHCDAILAAKTAAFTVGPPCCLLASTAGSARKHRARLSVHSLAKAATSEDCSYTASALHLSVTVIGS